MKPDVRPGDIFFIMHHDSWLSRSIAWYMNSKWSHTGIIVEKTQFYIYTSETSDFQVVGSYLEDYLSDKNVSMEILRLPVSGSVGVKMAADAVTRNQWLYGWLQLLVSFNLKQLLNKLHIRIKNFIRQGLVCCHHVLYACQNESGLPFFKDIDVENYQTQETYEMLKAQGAVTIFVKGIG